MQGVNFFIHVFLICTHTPEETRGNLGKTYRRIPCHSRGRATAGDKLMQPALAGSMECLAAHGLDAFYKGEMAQVHGDFLARAGSPLRSRDFTPSRRTIPNRSRFSTRRRRPKALRR